MSDPTARDLALSAARELRRADHHTDLVGAAATATVAIALHLTEPAAPGFLPVLTGDDSLVEQIAKAIADDDMSKVAGGGLAWDDFPDTSRDEYRSNARAVLALLRNLAPEQGPSSETRQPTGLARLLTEPTPAHLPGNILVTPTEWSVWNDDRTVYYGLVSGPDDGGSDYWTYRGDGTRHEQPSLAAAVAYLIQAKTQTGEAS